MGMIVARLIFTVDQYETPKRQTGEVYYEIRSSENINASDHRHRGDRDREQF